MSAGAEAFTLPEPERGGMWSRARSLWSERLWPVIRPHQFLLWSALAMLLVNSGCRLVLPYLMMTAIDDHLLAPEGLSGFWWLVGGYLGVSVLEAWGRRVQILLLERAGQNALVDLRMRVFRHLQRLPAAFFDRTPTGRLVGRVTTDIESLLELFSSGVVTVLGDIVFLAVAIGILLSLSVQLTLVTLLVVPLLLWMTSYIRGQSRKAYTALRERLSQLNGFLHEQVSGMAVVQAFAQEDRRRGEFGEINGELQRAQLRSVTWESLLSAGTEMLGSFTTALILWYGGTLALGLERDGLTLGVLFAFIDYMQRFFVPLNDLSMKWTVLQNALVASDRIQALLDRPGEKPDPVDAVVPAGPGRLEVGGVTFAYAPGNAPAVRELSFVVEPGQHIAIVGATGAGKSTILSLLTRLYEIEHGAIRLDGIDIRQIARPALRRAVGIVPQDVFLFRGTILDNILLGQPDATEEQAIAAARELGLDEIVARFPRGYHEPVAERGRNLSAGEKQLVAFARMLVMGPRVLALDEATANVDTRTEQILQDAVQRVMQGRTSLIVAHRLSTVRHADRILVMRRGELVEQGRHEDLLARGGAYAKLYELQFAD
jgi:ATP-binding cassette subfamily B multidrug efflux pump